MLRSRRERADGATCRSVQARRFAPAATTGCGLRVARVASQPQALSSSARSRLGPIAYDGGSTEVAIVRSAVSAGRLALPARHIYARSATCRCPVSAQTLAHARSATCRALSPAGRRGTRHSPVRIVGAPTMLGGVRQGSDCNARTRLRPGGGERGCLQGGRSRSRAGVWLCQRPTVPRPTSSTVKLVSGKDTRTPIQGTINLRVSVN